MTSPARCELAGSDIAALADGGAPHDGMRTIRSNEALRRLVMGEAVRRLSRDRGAEELTGTIGAILRDDRHSVLMDPCFGAWSASVVRRPAGFHAPIGSAVIESCLRSRSAVWLEPGFRVDLEDDNPARRLIAPEPSAALTSEGVRQWHLRLAAAWSHLVRHHQRWVPGIRATLSSVIPQRSGSSLRHVSASSPDAFGAVGVSATDDTPTLAVALVHEVQHLKLGALISATTLHRADAEPRYRVPWRTVLRPFEAFFQGVAAFTAVADFWLVEGSRRDLEDPDRDRALGQFRKWAPAVRGGLRTLRESGDLTEGGQIFVSGLEDVARRWEPAELGAVVSS